MSMYH